MAGDCLELRERLGAMRAERAQEVSETCASLARLWLPAEYEGSALASLKAVRMGPGDSRTVPEGSGGILRRWSAGVR